MGREEILIWSVTAGVFMAITAHAWGRALLFRTGPSVRLSVWLSLYGLSVMAVSGLPEEFFPGLAPAGSPRVFVLACMVAGASLYFLRFTVQSYLRSALMDRMLQVLALGLPLAAVAWLLMGPAEQWVALTAGVTYAGAVVCALIMVYVGLRHSEQTLVMGGCWS